MPCWRVARHRGFRAAGVRCADLFRQKGVVHRAAGGYLLQGIPYLHLEVRAANIERQVQRLVGTLNQVHYFRYHSSIVVLIDLDRSVRKLILQIAHKHSWVIPHHDRANQLLGRGDDDEAQRTRRDDKADGRSRSDERDEHVGRSGLCTVCV
jgi:hypothetical protein